jgi:hypothetical protein
LTATAAATRTDTGERSLDDGSSGGRSLDSECQLSATQPISGLATAVAGASGGDGVRSAQCPIGAVSKECSVQSASGQCPTAEGELAPGSGTSTPTGGTTPRGTGWAGGTLRWTFNPQRLSPEP